MDMLKAAGLFAAGAGLTALVGGALIWWQRRRQANRMRPQPVPKARRSEDDIDPDPPIPPEQTRPRGHLVKRKDLDPALDEVLNKLFEKEWAPSEEDIEELEPEDTIAFSVESEQTGNYTETRSELIWAQVLSIEPTLIRARIIEPVEHAEHFGSHAGHGYRRGDLVHIKPEHILVVTKKTDSSETGYGSQGKPAATFMPNDRRGSKPYKVRPGTPYDLVVPYPAADLQWHIDESRVEIEHLGGDGLNQQIVFTEGSLSGDVSVRLLANDPEKGVVFVGRWDFVLTA